MVQIESLGSAASIEPTAFDCDNGWVLGIGGGGGGGEGEEQKFERRLVNQLLSHLANQLVSQPVNRLVCELDF